jgi:predicted TIM-barrel fold metal-dependent hydrolase
MSLISYGAIDCDIHPALPGTKDLRPYLDDYWQEMLTVRNIDGLDLTSFPPQADLFGRPDWRPKQGKPGSDFEKVRSDLLDHFGVKYAIANCLYGAQAVYNEYLGEVLCRAMNDWLAHEWLNKDARLRASIVVSLANPDTAAEEIERMAADKRFVQVLVLAMGEAPLGRKQFWPIYRAAERFGLPIGIHAGSTMRHAQTQSGFVSYLVEDYVTQSQGFMAQVLSFIAEGVFVKFPGLRVVLIESGVSWMPSLMWRATKDWRGARIEIPWVKTTPASIIREHFRMTMQPFDAPPDSADFERLLNQFGSDEMFLFSTDYPHWQFDGDDALPAGMPDRLLQKILVDNPMKTYPRLMESAQ